jgi:hypothetical protein
MFESGTDRFGGVEEFGLAEAGGEVEDGRVGDRISASHIE